MEDDASKIYTDNVFFLIQKELNRVGGLCVKPAVQSDGFKTYIMWKHNRSEQSFEVVYSQGEGGPQFVCSCQKMEYEGIPCCHIFNVLKEEGILKIPTSLIMKRWRVIDEADVGKLDTRRLTGDKNEADSKLRFGYVSDMFSKLSFRASSSKETYEMVCEEVVKLERKIDAMFTVSEVNRQQDERERHDNFIRDPNIVKGKGKKKEPTHTTKKQGRKCSKCGGYGHNKQRCGKDRLSSPRVDTTSMTSGSSSEDEINGGGRGECNFPQANEAGPSSTIASQEQVHRSPFLPGYQGSPGMQNLLAGMHFNGMRNLASGYITDV